MTAEVGADDAGMKGIGRRPAFQATRQAAGKENVGELRLAVGPERAVALLAGQVVELNALLRRTLVRIAADHHHPGSLIELLQKRRHQQKVAQMVGGELLLDAADLLELRQRHDPGVGNKNVHAFETIRNRGRAGSNTVEIGEFTGQRRGGAACYGTAFASLFQACGPCR